MRKLSITIFSILLLSICSLAQNAEKVDEYGSYIGCDDYLGRLDAFAVNLQEKPNSTGVVIVYEGKYRESLPILGYAQNRMWEIRKHYEHRKLRIPKITYISGGFREQFTIELWVVPKGVEFPKASPTLSTMEYRKGKLSNEVCGQYTG